MGVAWVGVGGRGSLLEHQLPARLLGLAAPPAAPSKPRAVRLASQALMRSAEDAPELSGRARAREKAS